MRNNNVIRRNPWWALLVLLLLSGCFEEEEGCLDIAARNFAVDADIMCGDCCNYPTLSFDFRHKVISDGDTVNLSYNPAVYKDDFGQEFRFDDISYYLSNIRLVRSDGTENGVEDQLRIPLFNTNGDSVSMTVEDNFALVNPGDFSRKNIGTIAYSGVFASLKFQVGIDGDANRTQPEFLPVNHPLGPQEPEMYWNLDSGYIFNRIAFFRDVMVSDTVATVVELGTVSDLVEIQLPSPIDIPTGYNVTITLEIDYLSWLRGVDIRQDSKAAIKDKIVSNIANSFRVFSVRYSL